MAQVPPTAPPEARPAQAVPAVEERHAMPAGLSRWTAPTWPLRRATVLLLLTAVYFTTAKLGSCSQWSMPAGSTPS